MAAGGIGGPAAAAAAGIVSLCLLLAAPAGAATIVPDTFSDGGTGNCTLREATIAANEDRAVDGCPAGSGKDRIELGSGAYQLGPGPAGEDESASGDLDLTAAVTVAGVPGETEIRGSGTDRVLELAYGGESELIGLRISGGDVTSAATDREGMGGGILLSGDGRSATTTILDTTIVGNEAILGGGVGLRMEFSGAGGGSINNRLELKRSLLLSNHAERQGGGIYTNFSIASAHDSTFSGNTAGEVGGATGGDPPVVQLISSTVTGNAAPRIGGVRSAANSAGSIIAGNFALQSPDCAEVPLVGWNVVGDIAGCGAGSRTTDRIGTNPLLLPLADNGGPTLTHAIPLISPANEIVMSVGDGFVPCGFTDQRGAARGPIDGDTTPGAFCDAGAYEYIDCLGEEPDIIGTLGDDRLQGTPGSDVIAGFGGEDVIEGIGGGDLICAGLDDDVIDLGPGPDESLGGEGIDSVVGGAGPDRIDSGRTSDVMRGGGGADVLVGHSGKDRIWGNRGADKLLGGGRDDRCRGGPGRDIVRCEIRGG